MECEKERRNILKRVSNQEKKRKRLEQRDRNNCRKKEKLKKIESSGA